MNCMTFEENLSAYLDKTLTADEMLEIETHLETCAECRQELAELQQAVNLLASLDECIPPARFRRELRGKLEKMAGKKRFSWESFLQKLPKIRRSALVPAALAMIFIIVAIPFLINNPNISLSNTAKSKAAQNIATEGRGIAPEAAPKFTAKGLSDSKAADLAYGDNGGAAKEEALSKSATGARMSTTLTTQGSPALKAAEPVQIERKIIKNADLQLQVDSYTATVEELKKQTASLGGYLANESVSARDSQGVMRGHLQIRIPYLQFETFLNGLEVMGKVQNRNVYTQDVTEEFVDVESRLKALQTKEERLLAILQKAGQLADVLAVENELANTRSELESMQGRLRYLSSQVEHSTININIEQVVVPTQSISAGGLEGVWGRAKEAFIKAINNILLDTGKLVVWLSSALPYLLLLAIVSYVIWRWARKKIG